MNTTENNISYSYEYGGDCCGDMIRSLNDVSKNYLSVIPCLDDIFSKG